MSEGRKKHYRINEKQDKKILVREKKFKNIFFLNKMKLAIKYKKYLISRKNHKQKFF
uniref:Uncharacterized protein n=1 Tax=Meloidogyne enterolobii TaxID=390850 RepID=A0A6V7VHI9_MELEN|nr:unnamed protein product [Meloidogyne enterolobii]